MTKTLHNSNASGASKNVKDIQFWGDGDTFRLISKASSKVEGWMKSTKAMFVGTGCVIQVTTQQGDNVAEALTYVPGVRLKVRRGDNGAKLEGYAFSPLSVNRAESSLCENGCCLQTRLNPYAECENYRFQAKGK